MPHYFKDDDDDLEVVPLRLDRETLRRLGRLGRLVGRDPLRCAESLLYELARDDEMVNVYALTATTDDNSTIQ